MQIKRSGTSTTLQHCPPKGPALPGASLPDDDIPVDDAMEETDTISAVQVQACVCLSHIAWTNQGNPSISNRLLYAALHQSKCL